MSKRSERFDKALDSLPESARINGATDYVNTMDMVRGMTGSGAFTAKERLIAHSAWIDGYDKAMERGYAELLAENQSLQNERFDLATADKETMHLMKIRDAVLTLIYSEHKKACKCELCELIRAEDGA